MKLGARLLLTLVAAAFVVAIVIASLGASPIRSTSVTTVTGCDATRLPTSTLGLPAGAVVREQGTNGGGCFRR